MYKGSVYELSPTSYPLPSSSQASAERSHPRAVEAAHMRGIMRANLRRSARIMSAFEQNNYHDFAGIM